MKKPKDKQQKIKDLLESREKVLERIKRLNEVFKEEKENEDCWPGHEGTKYQTAGVEVKDYGKTG